MLVEGKQIHVDFTCRLLAEFNIFISLLVCIQNMFVTVYYF